MRHSYDLASLKRPLEEEEEEDERQKTSNFQEAEKWRVPWKFLERMVNYLMCSPENLKAPPQREH